MNTNLTYVQIIGPFYIQNRSFITPNLSKLFYTITRTEHLSDDNIQTWRDTTRNVLYNEGSYTEMLINSMFRFTFISLTHAMLALTYRDYNTYTKQEFGKWTSLPGIQNIQTAYRYYDIACALSPFFFEQSTLQHSIAGSVVGAIIGLPRTTALVHTLVAPETLEDYIKLVPVSLLYHINRSTKKLGVQQNSQFEELIRNAQIANLLDNEGQNTGLKDMGVVYLLKNLQMTAQDVLSILTPEQINYTLIQLKLFTQSFCFAIKAESETGRSADNTLDFVDL